MTQSTKVFQMDRSSGAALRKILSDEGWEFRKIAHAQYQARGSEVIATLYESGKMVVQGRGGEGFEARFLNLLGDAKDPKAKKETVNPVDSSPLPVAGIGSDEAGKGDTFGGMAVAAVLVTPDQVDSLQEAGVMDSKRIKDKRILLLAEWIEGEFPVAKRSLNAEQYNVGRQACAGNVNHLLTKLHCEVLRELHAHNPSSPLVVDRFSASSPVTKALKSEAEEVHEIPRAEAHPAVAAASIVARAAFLDVLSEDSAHAAVDLPLGSGAPVPPALRKVLELHGLEGLRRYTKNHFKNVQKYL
ncbi:MAG: hypothetical protein MK213_02235 [Planctomycetes bacterium]|nr:hypothetical protein [Planctomycetota bacterium]